MLEINNLTTGYADHPPITLQNLVVPSGQSCLIRGNSGTGKTTILNTIAGLHSPQSGTVKINNVSILDLAEQERDRFRGQNIGFVFQTLHLVKPLTVLENILLGAYAADKPQDQEWATHLLSKVGLSNLATRNADELSQGQAQRIAMARALMNKPSLLLADEPTSSLDTESAQSLIALLKSLSAEYGTTLVITSHDDRLNSHFNTVLKIGA